MYFSNNAKLGDFLIQQDYFDAGADAVALGGAIFSVHRMENQKFQEIQKDIEEFMFAVKQNYSKILSEDLTNR